jgi:hypothetical protein
MTKPRLIKEDHQANLQVSFKGILIKQKEMQYWTLTKREMIKRAKEDAVVDSKYFSITYCVFCNCRYNEELEKTVSVLVA